MKRETSDRFARWPSGKGFAAIRLASYIDPLLSKMRAAALSSSLSVDRKWAWSIIVGLLVSTASACITAYPEAVRDDKTDVVLRSDPMLLRANTDGRRIHIEFVGLRDAIAYREFIPAWAAARHVAPRWLDLPYPLDFDGVMSTCGLRLPRDEWKYITGDCVNGVANGIGLAYRRNHDHYHGEFRDGAFHGRGAYYSIAPWSSHSGTWFNGLRDGPGVYNSLERPNGRSVINLEVAGSWTSGRLGRPAASTYNGSAWSLLPPNDPASLPRGRLAQRTHEMNEWEKSYASMVLNHPDDSRDWQRAVATAMVTGGEVKWSKNVTGKTRVTSSDGTEIPLIATRPFPTGSGQIGAQTAVQSAVSVAAQAPHHTNRPPMKPVKVAIAPIDIGVAQLPPQIGAAATSMLMTALLRYPELQVLDRQSMGNIGAEFGIAAASGSGAAPNLAGADYIIRGAITGLGTVGGTQTQDSFDAGSIGTAMELLGDSDMAMLGSLLSVANPTVGSATETSTGQISVQVRVTSVATGAVVDLVETTATYGSTKTADKDSLFGFGSATQNVQTTPVTEALKKAIDSAAQQLYSNLRTRGASP